MSRRSGMTLYSDYQDIASHQVRLALAKKAINTIDIIWVSPNNPSEELLEINPYGTLPTLSDRDLVLYRTPIILEYLEERYPHPPLLPIYPVAKAKSRLMMFRIEQDWYSLFYKIQENNPTTVSQARKQLLDYFIMLSPVFEESPFFLSNEFSLIDCYIAPLLWRLPSVGLHLPSEARGIIQYAKRIFDTNAFKASLSEFERELGETITA